MSQIIIDEVKVVIKLAIICQQLPTSWAHQKLMSNELKLYVTIDSMWEIRDGLKDAGLKETLQEQEEKEL